MQYCKGRRTKKSLHSLALRLKQCLVIQYLLVNAKYQILDKLCRQLGRSMKKEALIITSTFTLIFHLITKITWGRSLYFVTMSGSKGQNPAKTFSEKQTELVLFMPHRLVSTKIPRLFIIVVPHLAHTLVSRNETMNTELEL